MKEYKPHQPNSTVLSRNEIGDYLDEYNFNPVGREHLHVHHQKKIDELEYLGGTVSDFYISPDRRVIFRCFINRAVWYQSINGQCLIWCSERSVNWVGG